MKKHITLFLILLLTLNVFGHEYPVLKYVNTGTVRGFTVYDGYKKHYSAYQTHWEQPKTVTVTFTVEELQVVYDALGELPSKKVEVIRYKIFSEAQKQLADTIKKK